MSKVISIHEYILKPGIGAEQIENAVRIAEGRGLFRLPGLVAYHFGQGIRGAREGNYAAIWIYESRMAWEALWGSVAHPRTKAEYPASWQVWEEELLAPLLVQEPDTITFTAYEELLLAS